MRCIAAMALLLAACGGETAPDGAPVTLEVWFHSGQPGERETIRAQVERFHDAQDDVRIRLELIPERSYNAQVQSAAVAGDLPDLLEFDGPYLYNYVWQGNLRPIGDLLPGDVRADLLPSIVEQGTFRGRLYSVGTFDSGLALYARRSVLEAAGVRVPDGPGDAWSADEFDRALAALAARDEDGAVLDLKLNYPGEWLTYAFSPILQSGGADLIDRADSGKASGVLDGAPAVAALARVQAWFSRGRVDPNVDDAAFPAGRVALSWVGHWEYPRYREAAGDDLVLVPLPDFGEGAKTGQGSWNWGITRRCEHPEAAARFLAFLLTPDEVLAMANANGAVPATRAAIARSDLYGAEGPLRLFVEQLEGGFAVPRPRTPAYPVITAAFQRAFLDIRDGADVRGALAKAATAIDQDIRDNQGYPMR